MKKILVILNSVNAPSHVISSAIEIAKPGNALLHAVFLIPPVYKPSLEYPFISDMSLTEVAVTGESIEQENQDVTNHNIQLFSDACNDADISFKVSLSRETSLEELIQHSAFADLIIADAKTDLSSSLSLPLTVSMSDLLIDTHCPVFLLQHEIKQPQQVVLTYDGSYSSAYALKQYSYIFPEWRNLPTSLLSIFSRSNKQMEHEEDIKDWLMQHFPNAKIILQHGDIKNEMVNAIKQYEADTLVVMGAYGRTAISRLFRKSLSNTIINETKAALFITHERGSA